MEPLSFVSAFTGALWGLIQCLVLLFAAASATLFNTSARRYLFVTVAFCLERDESIRAHQSHVS